MGISIEEFRVTMETYGAVRLSDRLGSRFSKYVPCFGVGNIAFLHSGSYYVVQRDGKVSNEIMNNAMKVLGEKCPGDKNFWHGEIHSVKGLLTLVSMIDNRYSKESVDLLTNEIYKKLLHNSLIRNASISSKGQIAPKMKKLRDLLIQYDNIVNPFANHQISLKDPIEYLDIINIETAFSNNSAYLNLTTENYQCSFKNNSEGRFYETTSYSEDESNEGLTNIIHYFINETNKTPADEIIYLNYIEGNDYGGPDDIDLRISMKTGLAWSTYNEEDAKPATNEQIETIISHLNTSIQNAKKIINNNMIKS